MARMIPYLVGGLTAFLVADILPIPSPSEHLGSALRAGFATAATVSQGTPASSINRAAKGDRGEVNFVTRISHLPEMAVGQQSTSVMKPATADRKKEEARDRARDRKPETSQRRKPPVGCDPMFSPVASPSLAHHFGLCMS